MGDTSISWTHKTWNPVVGCQRISEGCRHCYAFELHSRRHQAFTAGTWIDAPVQYRKPFTDLQLLPQRLEEPLRWKKPSLVFVNSMSDLFHPDIPFTYIAAVYGVMAAARRHTFQILTKRPERMLEFYRWATTRAVPLVETDTVEHPVTLAMRQAIFHNVPRARFPDPSHEDTWPLPNVWAGVSVEDQRSADARIPLLLEVPAKVRFLSCEPLLESVNLRLEDPHGVQTALESKRSRSDLLHWVIVGGESGARARGFDEAWARALRDQCRDAGIAFFLKQLGSVWARTWQCKSADAQDKREFPSDLQIQDFPRV
jgi:protein gp37